MTSLRFQLIKPDGRDDYRPGDLVSGLVHLNLFHDAALQAKRIEVAFSGRSEIDCTQQLTRWERLPWPGNSRTIFFDHVQTICVYDETHSPALGDSQWPFSFVFPSQSNPNQRLRRWQTSATLTTFPSEPGIPLPPSFHAYQEDWPAASTPLVYGWTSGRVSIIYELEARLVGGQGSYMRHSIRTLQFAPYSRLPTAEPGFLRQEHYFQSESRHLLSKTDKFSFRSSAKSLLLKAPVLVFKLITELPAYLIMGEVLPLYLGVEYDLEKSTAADLPPVSLREVRVGYLEQIQLGIGQPLYTSDRITAIQSPPRRQSIHYVFKKENMVPITERMALHQKLPPHKLVVYGLSFEIPNIRRFYHDFFLTITVICAGKEFTASSRIGGGEYSFIPPAMPPKGIELPGSRLLPPEAQSEPIYEMGKAAVSELQSERLHELESNLRSNQLQGAPAVELSAPFSAEVEAVFRPG